MRLRESEPHKSASNPRLLSLYPFIILFCLNVIFPYSVHPRGIHRAPKMRNHQFFFTPKTEYELVAESLLRRDKLREANQNPLTFPIWWHYTRKLGSILVIICEIYSFTRPFIRSVVE